jgi:hypothetical protein
MSERTSRKLSLRRETLRVLTGHQIALVAGGAPVQGSVSGEPSTDYRRCHQQPQPETQGSWFVCNARSPGQPDHSILQQRSIAYCLDKPPMSGRTLPPTAKD